MTESMVARALAALDTCVDFFRTVQQTVVEGVTEVRHIISPARKRRRSSDTPHYHPSVSEPTTSQPPNSTQVTTGPLPPPKRLRLSDASLSNAAGSSVPTPAGFRSTTDFLAFNPSSLRARDAPAPLISPALAQHQTPLPLSSPLSHLQPFSQIPASTRNSFAALQPTVGTLDVQKTFRYPNTPRRLSSLNLQSIWRESSPRSSALPHTAIQRVRRQAIQKYLEQAEIRRSSFSSSSAFPDASRRRFSLPASGGNQSRPQLANLPINKPRPSIQPTIKKRKSTAFPFARRLSSREPGTQFPTPFVPAPHTPVAQQTSAVAVSPAKPVDNGHTSLQQDVTSQPLDLPPVLQDLMAGNHILRGKLLKQNGFNLRRLAESKTKIHELRAQLFLKNLDLKSYQNAQKNRRQRLRDIRDLRSGKRVQPEKPPENPTFFDDVYWQVEDYDWVESRDAEAAKERKEKLSVKEWHSAFSSLTPSALKRLQATMSDDANYYKEISSIVGCVIHGHDLRRLKPNCWLNDEIINAYMELLTARSARWKELAQNGKLPGITAESFPRVKIMNSFFYSKLVRVGPKSGASGKYDYGYSRVRRWTRRFNVFTSFDVMLVPINEANLHWTLGVINLKDKMVVHLDSMGTGGSAHVREHLLRWVQDEAEEKKHDMNREEWKMVEQDVPMQQNSDDCGVFLCKYADFISRGWNDFTFSQRHMNYFRERIAHELLMGQAILTALLVSTSLRVSTLKVLSLTYCVRARDGSNAWTTDRTSLLLAHSSWATHVVPGVHDHTLLVLLTSQPSRTSPSSRITPVRSRERFHHSHLQFLMVFESDS